MNAALHPQPSASATSPLDRLSRLVGEFEARGLVASGGRVTEISATAYRVAGLSAQARLGDLIELRGKGFTARGEVIQIGATDILVSPLDAVGEPGVGDMVMLRGPFTVAPHPSWHGRTVDPLGRPLDGKGPLIRGDRVEGASAATPALLRQRVDAALRTGVRAIDIFTPLCYGQRLGVFAGSGVGKSTLLAMLACADAFDTVVVALVGERGREVREFLEDTLGERGLRKAVAVVATSDETAMVRRRAPDTAMRIAEHFRDRGHRVLLVLDSITRFAHALREVAVAAGEPPVSRGYPPSVFTELPRLLERAGPGPRGAGSITAIISVLVDGDDHNDPVSDSVRGILDGHVVLDRAIGQQGRYPAIDPLGSISRLSGKVWSPDERVLVARLKAMIARFEDSRDIRLLGAYQPGMDAELDMAIRQVPLIYEALKQSPADGPSADPFGDLARHLKAG